MKLYEAPRNSRIKYCYENYEYHLDFYHVDGMYSLCMDDNGQTVHLSASADVEVLHPLMEKK